MEDPDRRFEGAHCLLIALPSTFVDLRDPQLDIFSGWGLEVARLGGLGCSGV